MRAHLQSAHAEGGRSEGETPRLGQEAGGRAEGETINGARHRQRRQPRFRPTARTGGQNRRADAERASDQRQGRDGGVGVQGPLQAEHRLRPAEQKRRAHAQVSLLEGNDRAPIRTPAAGVRGGPEAVVLEPLRLADVEEGVVVQGEAAVAQQRREDGERRQQAESREAHAVAARAPQPAATGPGPRRRERGGDEGAMAERVAVAEPAGRNGDQREQRPTERDGQEDPAGGLHPGGQEGEEQAARQQAGADQDEKHGQRGEVPLHAA